MEAMMNKTIEIPIDLYNTFMNRAMKFELLRKAVADSIQPYATSAGLYVKNDLIEFFQLLCPYEYEKRIDKIKIDLRAKEGDEE